MKLLRYDNWKQIIAFDNIAYKDVKRYSLRLNTQEREIMERQIDFYRENFSLQQVFDTFAMLKTKRDKAIFKHVVLKRQDKILYLPDILMDYYMDIAKSKYKDDLEFFDTIIHKANKNSKKNMMPKLLKTIFGEYYSGVIKRVNKLYKQPEIKVLSKKLPKEGITNTAKTLIGGLENNKLLEPVFGKSSVKKGVAISVVDDYGFGHWQSKQVSYGINRFFVYSNNNKISNVELEHSVYLNVYPGYGHFYNTVVKPEENVSFDNGASYVINGWAMYAMCHSTNSAYATHVMQEGAHIAKHLLMGNLASAYKRVYLYLMAHYTKAQALRYLIDYTQYPGHYLSYVLGEIATELCIEKDFASTPIDYLNTLSKINCGDFFALYSPRMQKKIAKKSVTAKVAPKFMTTK